MSDSIVGWDEKERKRIQEKAKKAEERREQLDELEREIKARLEIEIETFQQDLLKKYHLLELEEELMQIRRVLVNDAEGKAKNAADQRIMQHSRMTMGTNMQWGMFINSFGFAGLWKRLFG